MTKSAWRFHLSRSTKPSQVLSETHRHARCSAGVTEDWKGQRLDRVEWNCPRRAGVGPLEDTAASAVLCSGIRRSQGKDGDPGADEGSAGGRGGAAGPSQGLLPVLCSCTPAVLGEGRPLTSVSTQCWGDACPCAVLLGCLGSQRPPRGPGRSFRRR